MDRFLWASNPNKPAKATGLQGYIIDTVKGVWYGLEIEEVLPDDALHPAFYTTEPDKIEKVPGRHRMYLVRKNVCLLDNALTMANRAAHWWMAWQDAENKPYTLFIDVTQINNFFGNYYEPEADT